MKIDVRQQAGVAIVSPRGKLTIGGGGDVALREQIEQTVGTKPRGILISLGDVTAMDSSGLGELIAAQKMCRDRGTDIKIMDLNQKMSKIMTMTRLVGIFEIFENEAQAVASFGE